MPQIEWRDKGGNNDEKAHDRAAKPPVEEMGGSASRHRHLTESEGTSRTESAGSNLVLPQNGSRRPSEPLTLNTSPTRTNREARKERDSEENDPTYLFLRIAGVTPAAISGSQVSRVEGGYQSAGRLWRNNLPLTWTMMYHA